MKIKTEQVEFLGIQKGYDPNKVKLAIRFADQLVGWQIKKITQTQYNKLVMNLLDQCDIVYYGNINDYTNRFIDITIDEIKHNKKAVLLNYVFNGEKQKCYLTLKKDL